MIDLQQFHFLRPYCLLALLPLAVLLWWMVKQRLGSRSWEGVCDKALLPHVLIGGSSRNQTIAVVLIGACAFIAIIALAGPVWEKLPQPVFSHRGGLVIALDLSRSMDADDITPSRLARARYKIEDILRQRKEGQSALLVYAGDAFTVSPLTDDTTTIISQLKALSTDIMPVMGNRSDLALLGAMNLLKQAGVLRGDILLLTDEVNYEQSRAAAEQVTGAGYRISIIGVGTERGVPVPMADGSFLKDANGQIVIPGIDEQAMRELAQLGAGRYRQISVGDDDVNEVSEWLSAQIGEDMLSNTELQTDAWLERGPWLLLLLLPFALMVFRRGYLVVLLIFLLPLPEPAAAFDWQDLWRRPDQQARQALEQGDVEKAAELFKEPVWKGAAHYRAGDFAAASRSLENVQDRTAQYIRGNALARLGRYEEAIAEYDKVLAQQADHEDALLNKELLEQELQKQQEQQQQEQQQQDGKDGAQDDARQQEQEQQQGQQQDQQQGQGEERQQERQEQQAQQAQEGRGEQEQKELEGLEGEKQMSAAALTPDEEQQATEQWLRRIPDDPAGLLRRKFLYQYQQRQARQNEKTW